MSPAPRYFAAGLPPRRHGGGRGATEGDARNPRPAQQRGDASGARRAECLPRCDRVSTESEPCGRLTPPTRPVWLQGYSVE